tara:strand:+ start:63 stop:221 length:159 start_codon:yes stop_codon:yes gene_type:complete
MTEFRFDKDPLMKKGKKIGQNERYADHYRRFINFENIKSKMKRKGFKIIYHI